MIQKERTCAACHQAVTCPGGATLAREQIQAADKEHVLNAVGTAATAMRARLGEPHNSIQKLNRPLEQATTPSLEALQNYNEGYNEMTQGHFLAAIPLFERAIALDPNFAMAYYGMAMAFNVAGDTGRQAEYIRKAFALIDRVSEYERYHIAAGYYDAAEFQKILDHKGAPVGPVHGAFRIGDCTTRSPTWGWRVPLFSRATRRKPGRRSRTSSNYGRTPTGISLFSSKQRKTTRHYVSFTPKEYIRNQR